MRNSLAIPVLGAAMVAMAMAVGCGDQGQAGQDWGGVGDAAGDVATPDATDPDLPEGDQGGRPDPGGGDSAGGDSGGDSGDIDDPIDNGSEKDTNNPQDTGPGDPGSDVPEWTGPDLSGMWAQLQVSSTMTKPVIGQASASVTRSLSLLRIAQDGPDLIVSYHVCDFSIDNGSSVVSTVVPDAFVEALLDSDKPARIDSGDGGWTYFQPPFVELFGLKAGFDGTTLPEKADDPAVIDQDEDGKPGMTIQMAGLVQGSLYMIQRRTSSIHGPLDQVAEGIFDGLIDFTNEQVYLGSDNATLLQMLPERYPDNDPSHSYYRTSRFEFAATTDEAFCKYIIDNQEMLFTRGDK